MIFDGHVIGGLDVVVVVIDSIGDIFVVIGGDGFVVVADIDGVGVVFVGDVIGGVGDIFVVIGGDHGSFVVVHGVVVIVGDVVVIVAVVDGVVAVGGGFFVEGGVVVIDGGGFVSVVCCWDGAVVVGGVVVGVIDCAADVFGIDVVFVAIGSDGFVGGGGDGNVVVVKGVAVGGVVIGGGGDSFVVFYASCDIDFVVYCVIAVGVCGTVHVANNRICAIVFCAFVYLCVVVDGFVGIGKIRI